MDECAPDDTAAAFMKVRHGNSRMIIKSQSGTAVVLRPGCGGMQGDVPMPAIFGGTYNPALEQWIDWKFDNTITNIYARHPETNVDIEVGTSGYADDVGETLLNCHDAGAAQDIIKDTENSTQALDTYINPLGLAQNLGKTEYTFCVRGPGADKDMKTLQAQDAVQGKVKSVARYLGSWLAWNGTLTVTFKKRIDAVHEAYWTCKGFWGRKVPLTVKRGTFIGLVYNTALSGLEAEVPTYRQMKRLESVIMKYARKLLGKESVQVVEGVNRQKSDEWVRA